MFCENSNAGKVKLKKCYLFTLILLFEKDATQGRAETLFS